MLMDDSARVTTEPTLVLDEAWTEGTLYLPEGRLWYSLVSADEDELESLRVLKTSYQRSSYGAEFCGCPWQGSGKGGAKLKKFRQRYKAGREDN